MMDTPLCPLCGNPRTAAFVDYEDGTGELRSWCHTCDGDGPMIADPAFGEAFRKARVERRVTLRDAAKRMDMPVMTLSRIERGRHEPTAEERERMTAFQEGAS